MGQGSPTGGLLGFAAFILKCSNIKLSPVPCSAVYKPMEEKGSSSGEEAGQSVIRNFPEPSKVTFRDPGYWGSIFCMTK